ncbi:MAG TPA: Calx-beta domain-containing protein, partial [Humisphaera sp.]
MKIITRILGSAVAVALVAASLPARAAVTYGTPAADSALRFNPYTKTTGSTRSQTPWSQAPVTAAPLASLVRAPALRALERTPVTPGESVVDVVDAPVVFEAPYLSGLKASFVVTINKPATSTVTVKYRTVNGTGRAGIEYGSKTGTITFAPGQYAQTVLVDVLNDDLKVSTNAPGPRTFFLEVYGITGPARIGRDRGLGKIAENGKKQVGITLTNALPVYETGTGLKAVFSVVLNQPSSKTVSVAYTTLDGTAKASQGDYKAVAGTLVFSPGQTTKQVSVPIFNNNSTTTEAIVEAFYLQLSSPVNAILLRKMGTAEIVEYSNGSVQPPSGSTPTVSISPISQTVVEGNTGTKVVNFTVSLSKPSAAVVKVYYSTANNGATSGVDYALTYGTLTFQPGQTTKSLSVNVFG